MKGIINLFEMSPNECQIKIIINYMMAGCELMFDQIDFEVLLGVL